MDRRYKGRVWVRGKQIEGIRFDEVTGDNREGSRDIDGTIRLTVYSIQRQYLCRAEIVGGVRGKRERLECGVTDSPFALEGTRSHEPNRTRAPGQIPWVDLH